MKLSVSVVIVGLLISQSAMAQNRGAHFLGGRSSGMGGAAIAFGNDAGMAFYNPAGLARIPSHILNLSVAAYSLDVYRYNKFFAQQNPPDIMSLPGEITGNELYSSTINTYPSSLSYVGHFGEHNLAFSVLVPRIEKKRLWRDDEI